MLFRVSRHAPPFSSPSLTGLPRRRLFRTRIITSIKTQMYEPQIWSHLVFSVPVFIGLRFNICLLTPRIYVWRQLVLEMVWKTRWVCAGLGNAQLQWFFTALHCKKLLLSPNLFSVHLNHAAYHHQIRPLMWHLLYKLTGDTLLLRTAPCSFRQHLKKLMLAAYERK